MPYPDPCEFCGARPTYETLLTHAEPAKPGCSRRKSRLTYLCVGCIAQDATLEATCRRLKNGH